MVEDVGAVGGVGERGGMKLGRGNRFMGDRPNSVRLRYYVNTRDTSV